MSTAICRLAIVASLCATTAACTTHSVRRAALVPHAAPTMRDGQPIGDAVAAVDLGISTVASARQPREGDPDAGLHIPRVQGQSALRFQARPDFDIGLIYERGLEKGSVSIADDQPEPDGDAQGLGLSLGYSVPTGDPNFRVGLSMDLISYSIPYIEYRTCVSGCGGVPYTEVEHHTAHAPVISIGAVPSYQNGPWTFFGSLTARNHPTVERGGLEAGVENDVDLEAGPMNLIGAVGVSFTTPARVKASLLLYQPISRDPISYAPTLAAGLSLPFGTKKY